MNNSIKLIVIIDVKEAIFTKKTIDVIKYNPKNIGKNVIANCEYKYCFNFKKVPLKYFLNLKNKHLTFLRLNKG